MVQVLNFFSITGPSEFLEASKFTCLMPVAAESQGQRRKPSGLSSWSDPEDSLTRLHYICLYYSWNPNLRMCRECLCKTERRPCPALEASTLTLMPQFCAPFLSAPCLLLPFGGSHSPSFLIYSFPTDQTSSLCPYSPNSFFLL